MSPQESIEDVLYRRAVPGIEEWFRLMEWLLVISALALATGFSNNQYLPILVHISVLLFVGHCVFVLPERFMRSFPTKVKGLSKPKRTFRAFVFLLVLFALMLMAYRLVSIAQEFGAELAKPVAAVAT
jgi:hypothetical protein